MVALWWPGAYVRRAKEADRRLVDSAILPDVVRTVQLDAFIRTIGNSPIIDEADALFK